MSTCAQTRLFRSLQLIYCQACVGDLVLRFTGTAVTFLRLPLSCLLVDSNTLVVESSRPIPTCQLTHRCELVGDVHLLLQRVQNSYSTPAEPTTRLSRRRPRRTAHGVPINVTGGFPPMSLPNILRSLYSITAIDNVTRTGACAPGQQHIFVEYTACWRWNVGQLKG